MRYRKRGKISNRNGIHKGTGVGKCGKYSENGNKFRAVVWWMGRADLGNEDLIYHIKNLEFKFISNQQLMNQRVAYLV